MPKIDVPAVTNSTQDERGKRWISVPDKDLFEFPFPTVRVNLMAFEAGQKYFVDAELADFLEDRIKIKEAADRRILMRNPDLKAQDAMNRFGSGRGGHFVANPDSVMG